MSLSSTIGVENSQALTDESSSASAKLRVLTLPTVTDPFANNSIQNLPCWWKWLVQVAVFPLFLVRLSCLLCIVLPCTLLTLLPYSACCDPCFGRRRTKKSTNTPAVAQEQEQKQEQEPQAPAPAQEQEQQQEPDELPHGCCRSCMVYPLRLLNRLLLWCLGFFWISITRQPGCSSSSAPPSVIVANHTALMDAMFMGWFFAPMAVAKIGVKNIPVAGGVAVALQTIFVDRKNKSAKQQVLQVCVE